MATRTSPVTVQLHSFDSPEAQQLVTALDIELAEVYHDFPHLVDPALCGNPVPSSRSPDPASTGQSTVQPSNTSSSSESKQLNFFIAFTRSTSTHASEAVGCIALRSLSVAQYPLLYPSHPQSSTLVIAELKRLFILPSHRNLGIAQQLYKTAEAFARDQLGVDVLVIETGSRQEGALKLYERNGFRRRLHWGCEEADLVENGGVNLYMEKWMSKKDDVRCENGTA